MVRKSQNKKHRLIAIHFALFFITILLSNAQQSHYDLIVSKDNSSNFKTVQEAINAVPDYRKKRTVIFIKNGVYKEKLILAPSKTMVTLVGEDKHKTIITYDDYASKKNIFGEEMGTTGSSSFFVFGDDFTAENITFENSSGPVGQAVAVRIDGDRVIFKNCRFLGFQDTLYPHGENSRQYYKNCYIEGTVDFIFGWATAVFDECEIFCKTGGGYITAPSTNPERRYGFVFLTCKITGDAPENSFYLGRPWRNYAQAVFINCYLDKHIRSEGWHNWGKKHAETTAFFGEHKNTGPGFKPKERVRWSYQLSGDDVKEYTLDRIFEDWDVNNKGD